MSLAIIPIDFDEACAFVAQHHRHHKPPQGHKFSLAVATRRQIGSSTPGGAGYGMHVDVIVGVAIVGRPVARSLDDRWTLEVTRCATDGTKNACSALYAAAWRAARAIGYRRLVTYTLPAEGGASLRAAGWRTVHKTKGGNWNTPARPRVDTAQHLAGQKQLWEVAA
jgi:hypothetical protein